MATVPVGEELAELVAEVGGLFVEEWAGVSLVALTHVEEATGRLGDL